jgi:UDP-glucose 4-epimerase
MRVLVTGATGFIGGALLRTAPSEWEIAAVGRGGPPAGSSVTEGIEWVDADLSEPGFERRLPGDIDAVVHLAQAHASSGFPGSVREIVDLNVTATARLLEHARTSKAHRFILASTATVYRRAAVPLNEDAPVDCASFYAASKRSAELLTRPYGDLLACHALRLFTVYGEGQAGRLIPNLVARVRAGEPVSVDGNRGLLLSPVHVHDVVAALVATVEHQDGEPQFEITNVGGPDALGIREIAEILGRVVAREPRFEQRGGEDPGGFVADISKLSRTLPVAPPRGFEAGAAQSFASQAVAPGAAA